MIYDLKSILYLEDDIRKRVKELGKQIEKDYYNQDLVIVTILKGAAPFACDLVRNIDSFLKMDYLIASSYGSGTSSSGEVKIIKDIDTDVKGKNVLLIDDILDTGLTLKSIKELFIKEKQPRSIKTCVLLDKPERREVDIQPDYYGFTIPNVFVVGYGLDYNQFYRNLPYIGVLKEEKYEI